MIITKKLLAIAGAVALFGAGLSIGAGMASKPKSVLHIITMKFKDGTTADQKKAVTDGIEKMAADPKLGITHVWLSTKKVQPSEYSNVFVMEFKDAAAFTAYTNAAAHKDWEKVYLPVRGESTTSDASNE